MGFKYNHVILQVHSVILLYLIIVICAFNEMYDITDLTLITFDIYYPKIIIIRSTPRLNITHAKKTPTKF